jgi:CRISPR/Cas system-associated protein endoribonuclease Cas2
MQNLSENSLPSVGMTIVQQLTEKQFKQLKISLRGLSVPSPQNNYNKNDKGERKKKSKRQFFLF